MFTFCFIFQLFVYIFDQIQIFENLENRDIYDDFQTEFTILGILCSEIGYSLEEVQKAIFQFFLWSFGVKWRDNIIVLQYFLGSILRTFAQIKSDSTENFVVPKPVMVPDGKF